MTRSSVSFLFVAALLVWTPASTLCAQFEADARWAPPTTNVLVLVNSSRMLESPLARQEKGKDTARAAFATGTSIVTPDVDRLMIASEVDLEALHSRWTVAVFSRKAKPFDFNGLVNRIAGTIDPISGKNTVLVPNDAIVAQLGPMSLGAMKPGNRQSVARWLKDSSSIGSSQIADYLKRAVKFADNNADMIFAVDLEGVLNPLEIQQRLAKLSSVPADQAATVAETLSQIEGITLGVTIRDSATGSLKIDFKTDASKLATVGKPLLIEVLKNKGLMIDDFESWNAKAAGQSLVLSGPLSISGLRTLNALISQPMLPELIEETGPTAPAEYARTKTYFDSIESYYKDLNSKQPDTKSLRAYGSFFDLYADKIDALSVLGVDPQAIALGASLSENLRGIGSGMRGTQAALNAQQGYLRANNGYVDYGYRYSTGSRISQKKALDQGAESFAEVQTREVMLKLSKEVAETRRALTTKYGVTF